MHVSRERLPLKRREIASLEFLQQRMALLPASCELIGIAVYACKAQSSATKSGMNKNGAHIYTYIPISSYIHTYKPAYIQYITCPVHT